VPRDLVVNRHCATGRGECQTIGLIGELIRQKRPWQVRVYLGSSRNCFEATRASLTDAIMRTLMSLSSGTKLGPYEIQAPLGAGGMGEVYRARDTRLERTVAIKVVPEHLSSNLDAKQRFEREARAISSLNHPHICALYDVGTQDGVDFLVMEYLEGQTLADRLQKGAVPIEEVLKIGIEIADALDRAHRQGIVHRDLKPGNIMLTKAGAKLMDFGLAKPAEAAFIASASVGTPTLSNRLTVEGTIVGTFQYMAPEQLEGKEADARTDVFGLGCVLYEMATGRPAFTGKSKASLIASILSSQPPGISTFEPMTPPALDWTIRTCLAKNPDERWQCFGDIVLVLKWIATGSPHLKHEVKPRYQYRRWVALATPMVIAVAAVCYLLWMTPPRSRDTTRFVLRLPVGQSLVVPYTPYARALDMSADGRYLAYVAQSSGQQAIYVRPVDQFEAKPVPGTENGEAPFFSPDGEWLGFIADGKLKKVPLRGGPPFAICDVQIAAKASWGKNGYIVVLPIFGTGLSLVSANGGTPSVLTNLDLSRSERVHTSPEFLPTGDAVLFTIWTGVSFERPRIAVLSLKNHQQKVLIDGATSPHYVSTGHLVYEQGGSLFAVPFDISHLELSGTPVRLSSSPQMSIGQITEAQLAVSATGTMAYVPGPDTTDLDRTLVWVNRKGVAVPASDVHRPYASPRISPDGRRIAVSILESGNYQIWIYDLERHTLSRLTHEKSNAMGVWSPDGKQIAFGSNLSGSTNIYAVSADGNSSPERLTSGQFAQLPNSWSKDNALLWTEVDPTTVGDIWVLSPHENAHPISLRKTPFDEFEPAFSPDGRFIAYVSNDSGTYEVYVQTYSGPYRRWQISTRGGFEPVWAKDGRELFYLVNNKMIAVPVKFEAGFHLGKPQTLFEASYEPGLDGFPPYDVSADGKRFLFVKPNKGQPTANEIDVTVGWATELQSRFRR
jgi:Tol biopolymer transport system component/predicted Ser/Thr protein kinase